MKYLKTLILGLLGGIAIGFGGTVFLAAENKIFGTILFTVGLFIICTKGYYLFTGKVAYIFDRKPSYLFDVAIIWFGNLLGTMAVAGMILCTRFATDMQEKAQGLLDKKLSGTYLSVFVLGILCNALIYIGTDGFIENKHEIGKYLGLFFAICVFLTAGFEHCIANMYYVAMAWEWNSQTILFLLATTAGNIVGGVMFPLLQKAAKACDRVEEKK